MQAFNLLPVREICDEVIRLTQLNELTMELENFQERLYVLQDRLSYGQPKHFALKPENLEKNFCPPRRGLSFQ